MSATTRAYPLNLLTILPGSSEGGTTGCDREASFVVMPCGAEDSGDPPATTSAGPSTGGPVSTGSGGAGESSGGVIVVRAKPRAGPWRLLV